MNLIVYDLICELSSNRYEWNLLSQVDTLMEVRVQHRNQFRGPHGAVGAVRTRGTICGG